MSAFPLEADLSPCPSDVGFGPIADLAASFGSRLLQYWYCR